MVFSLSPLLVLSFAAGTDIFSDSQGLVIFKDYSWKTDKGFYIATEHKFLPEDGVEVPEGYVDSINRRVEKTFWASAKILETNYYRTILSDEQKEILDNPIPLP